MLRSHQIYQHAEKVMQEKWQQKSSEQTIRQRHEAVKGNGTDPRSVRFDSCDKKSYELLKTTAIRYVTKILVKQPRNCEMDG